MNPKSTSTKLYELLQSTPLPWSKSTLDLNDFHVQDALHEEWLWCVENLATEELNKVVDNWENESYTILKRLRNRVITNRRLSDGGFSGSPNLKRLHIDNLTVEDQYLISEGSYDYG